MRLEARWLNELHMREQHYVSQSVTITRWTAAAAAALSDFYFLNTKFVPNTELQTWFIPVCVERVQLYGQLELTPLTTINGFLHCRSAKRPIQGQSSHFFFPSGISYCKSGCSFSFRLTTNHCRFPYCWMKNFFLLIPDSSELLLHIRNPRLRIKNKESLFVTWHCRQWQWNEGAIVLDCAKRQVRIQ